ncbi:ubiquitin-like small archaeal modifier protein 1 [Halolamina pelagica]|uniref:Ubiquitin-like small archaeal modifier protein 1 n=1 Tax=Halolamina pelagica TaxID=699431 RepID=A0A0N8I0H8_9EURY|nr:ubiquitin-like small modifier protein 1 [Halolamina pelagica]KPN29305.1 ubiquitin-like small archaeal modifier protein 1 [Halolamina pelagica]KPN32347.1 ubiquitin-like small archaeal modifier protein 1 [Halolamina pelagica]
MQWKLFADLAEAAGDRTVAVDVDDDASVGDALEALLAAKPALRDRALTEDGDLRGDVNLLKNGENVDPDDGVDAGDELALFPPVSGG